MRVSPDASGPILKPRTHLRIAPNFREQSRIGMTQSRLVTPASISGDMRSVSPDRGLPKSNWSTTAAASGLSLLGAML
jgi:hypothetical protein